MVIKPPNVLICADIESETDNLTDLLLQVLEEDRHVIESFILDSIDIDFNKLKHNKF